jgi:MFS family permease
MIITMAGLGLGQITGGLDDGTAISLFLVASILVSIAVVPILISVSPAPEFAEPESVPIRRLYAISPLAMVGMGLQGVTAAVTFGLGAIYATKIGLTSFQAAVFVASVTIGNMVLQYPVGKLSDIFDRRKVIMIVSAVAGISAFSASLMDPSHYWILVVLTALYGGFSLTIYSLCIAHANDYLTPSQMVGTASTLITVNGIGAIIGPPLVGALMDIVGTQIYFVMIALIHALLVGMALVRMSVRAAVPIQAQGPFIAVPEVGTAVAATLNPEAAWSEEEDDVDPQAPLFEDNPYLQITPTSQD